MAKRTQKHFALQAVAEAIRRVIAVVERELETGRRSNQFSTDEFASVMLDIADDLAAEGGAV